MKKYFIVLLLILLPVLVFAQEDAQKKKAYFFYVDACPHCHNANDYFNANGLYDKYDIEKLDASVPQNGQLLMKFYEANNYPENQRGGVPAIAFGDKFLIGDTPIIDNFASDIEASQNANQLPNPNKNGTVPDVVVHDGPIGVSPAQTTAAAAEKNVESVNSGNKKNYTPVVIGALVLLGAGALIFVNRDK